MKKIYNCFDLNELERVLSHRGKPTPGYRGNSVICDVMDNCSRYGFTETKNPMDADIFLTNDVWPSVIHKNTEALRVKRLDGFNYTARDRDIPHVEAVKDADIVICLSHFSLNKYISEYPEIFKDKHCSVVHNWVDPEMFPSLSNVLSYDKKTMITVAADWKYKADYAHDDISDIASVLNDDEQLIVIGRNQKVNHPKIIQYDYMDRSTLWKYLNISHIFIHLSEKEACDKVVCEALSCGLPVIHKGLGGTKEIIPHDFIFRNKTDIRNHINDIFKDYDRLTRYIMGYSENRFNDMLNKYYLLMRGKHDR
jgi:glycosyltransferase involved in cell wall biosynthesis